MCGFGWKCVLLLDALNCQDNKSCKRRAESKTVSCVWDDIKLMRGVAENN